MANNTGKKFGGRRKGVPNKVTTEVKSKLVELTDGTIDELSHSQIL